MVLNPFKKHDVSEFEGVLVPLAQEPHSNNVASQRDGLSPATHGEKAESDGKSSQDDSEDRSGAPSIRAGTSVGLTLEQLRASVDEDLAAGDMQTAYDRKYCGP